MPLPLGKPISTGAIIPPHRVLPVIFGVALAMLVSPDSVLVLCFGLAGSSGNSFVTGAFLVITTVVVGLLCFRRDMVIRPVGLVILPDDLLFFALLLCIVSSFALNGWTSNTKEYQSLILSLAAYPACRFISRADIVSGRLSFIWCTGVIVLLGSIATAAALSQQWEDPHGKPLVFGFDAAATHFLQSLSFLVIALVTAGRLTMRRTVFICSLVFLPTAIFAASLVRYTFVALAGTLCLAAMLSEARQRMHVVAIALVMLVAIAAGLLARYDKVRLYADYAMEQTSGNVGRENPPSCYLKVNVRNSIAIRKVLVQDAVFLIPGAGWTGTGLDSFMKYSCIKLTEVHNSFLQAAVEFGWLGGSLLFLMIVVAAGSILRQSKHDAAARFVLCSFAFVVVLSFAHGRISRDGILFALLGSVVGLKAVPRSPAISGVAA